MSSFDVQDIERFNREYPSLGFPGTTPVILATIPHERIRQRVRAIPKAGAGATGCGQKDDVLDVGCGPGHITYRLKRITSGRVVGTDISAGMIAQAQAQYPEIEFGRVAAEALDHNGNFDVVFCNSTMQWFTEPAKAVRAMRKALRPGGRIGVSCPATENWSTCLMNVAAEAGAHADTSATFARWKSPWFYLPDERGYRHLFEAAGLETVSCQIALEEHPYAIEQAVNVFASGAAQGYTAKEFYEVAIDDDYVRRFNDYVRIAMEHRARDGTVVVDFRRLYYVGRTSSSAATSFSSDRAQDAPTVS
jgi:trans-aconitate methyltransferase